MSGRFGFNKCFIYTTDTLWSAYLTVLCFVFWQPCLNTAQVQSYQDESYVPMASPSPSATTVECDGYIPMSPRTFSFLNTNCSVASSPCLSTLMSQPGDLAPPPIHRHLKPRLRRGEGHTRPDQAKIISVLSLVFGWTSLFFSVCVKQFINASS